MSNLLVVVVVVVEVVELVEVVAVVLVDDVEVVLVDVLVDVVDVLDVLVVDVLLVLVVLVSVVTLVVISSGKEIDDGFVRSRVSSVVSPVTDVVLDERVKTTASGMTKAAVARQTESVMVKTIGHRFVFAALATLQSIEMRST